MAQALDKEQELLYAFIKKHQNIHVNALMHYTDLDWVTINHKLNGLVLRKMIIKNEKTYSAL